jgi:hypothetical protein
MARPSKIDQLGLAEKVLAMALTKTSREISAVLRAEGYDISHVAVARYIKGVRQERAEQTKALVQDTIKATVPRDLEVLEHVRDQLDGWRRDEGIDLPLRLQVIDRLQRVIELRLKHCGAEEGAQDLLDAIVAAYRERTAGAGG